MERIKLTRFTGVLFSIVYDSIVYDSIIYDSIVYDSIVYDSISCIVGALCCWVVPFPVPPSPPQGMLNKGEI